MNPRSATASLLTVLAAVALGACGSQGGGGSQQATSGQAVFRQAGCAGCHTLKAAKSTGTTGPDLDQIKPSAAVVERQVRNGGRGMPSFGGRLSDQQIKAVAAYVSRSAGR